jgi:hypothetical protein
MLIYNIIKVTHNLINEDIDTDQTLLIMPCMIANPYTLIIFSSVKRVVCDFIYICVF